MVPGVHSGGTCLAQFTCKAEVHYLCGVGWALHEICASVPRHSVAMAFALSVQVAVWASRYLSLMHMRLHKLAGMSVHQHMCQQCCDFISTFPTEVMTPVTTRAPSAQRALPLP